MKNYFILLLSLSGLLILGNFFLLMEFGPEVHRWGRVISTTTFLVIFLTQLGHKKIMILGALFMLLVADIVALTYQKVASQQAFFAFQTLAYLLLIIHAGRFLFNQNLRLNQTIYFGIVFLLNTFFMLVIGDLLAEEVNNPGVVALFYVYGFSSIILISTGILYYDRFPNDRSASFLFTAIGLVLSNLMGFPAHFMDFWEFFFLDRLFYVLGTAGLLAYVYHSKKHPTPSTHDTTGDEL